MKNALRIYLISNKKDSRQIFSTLGTSTACQSGWNENLQLALQEIPADIHVLVVEPGIEESALEFIKTWIAEHKSIPVFVITDSADLDVVRYIMRSGARDVFLKPLKGDEIMKEMQQVMIEKEADEEGKLIAFMDVKGGNGCTTLAVNVAEEIARTGSMKTLLIDLDIQFGDVIAMMDKEARSTVLEAISQAERLDQSMLASMVTEVGDGLHVLASPGRLIELDAIRPVDVQKLFETAIDLYDLVIVDLPRVITPWVSEVLRWSDHIFLVAQGSVSDVRDGNLILKHLNDIGATQSGIHFVHNRAGVKHASVSSEQLSKAFNTERLISVREDYEVASHASDLGKSLSEYSKNSRLTKDIKALSELIMEMCGHQVEKDVGAFSRFFKKYGGHK